MARLVPPYIVSVACYNTYHLDGEKCDMTYRKLPARISRLGELAYNLWWSWHPLGRDLFRALDYQP
jgi:hypothetical protein